MKTITQRTLLTITAVAVVVIVWLLIESRPPLPTTTGLTDTSNLDRLLGCLAWLGSLMVSLGLLGRIVGRRSPVDLEQPAPIRSLRHRRRAVHPYAIGGYASRAFPLIIRPGGDAPEAEPSATAPEGPALQPSARPQPESATEAETPVESSAAEVRISVLGQLLIEGGSRHGRKLRGPTRDVLAYLALHQHGAHRDQLTDEIWPDQSPEQARNRLWRAAADARSHFGDTFIIRNGEHYQLNRALVRVDLDQLREQQAALAHSRNANDELSRLEAALALFRGEPLAGSDLPWAENEQRYLHALRLELLERAGYDRLKRGDASGALADAEDGLTQEPYNEQFVRLAMQAEAALGLRVALSGRYEHLRELLERDLGLLPHRETRALYRTLLGQDHAIEAPGQEGQPGADLHVARSR